MGQFSKPWEELTIADNFIFCKVMQNAELCKEILELLLDIQIEKIEYLQTESPIENFYDTRGVRLDVVVKDSKKVYDIEMQTGNYDDIILRSRYYQASLDVSTTKRRTKFKDLKETYIIFICKDDPFGIGLPRYTKISKFMETDKISYDDKTHNVFYNCSGYKNEKDIEVQNVLRFIYELKAESDLTKKMEDAAETAKINSDYRVEYMYVQDVIEEEKEIARETGLAEGREKGLAEGREKGLAEGREKGLAEGRAEGLAKGEKNKAEETAKKMLEKKYDLQDIADITGLSIEEIKKISA